MAVHVFNCEVENGVYSDFAMASISDMIAFLRECEQPVRAGSPRRYMAYR